jgi:GMP synthase (glutamine-hydrolysing)
MRRLRIALLNASHGAEHTPRNFRRELDADLAEFDVTAGELPTDHDFDAAVVTGSRASVYWDREWIVPTAEWVRRAHEQDMPLLGVCWGHQLIAHALGGTVADMGEYEIGYRTIERTAADPLLAGIDAEFLAFTTHSDAVVDLPPGATEIAENDYGNHGFQVGNAFGVQFHPEYDPDSARRVTNEKDDLDAERKQAVLDGITDANYERACKTKQLFDNFTRYVRDRRPVAAD